MSALDDPTLVAFEQGTLDPASFHHRDHLYVAWCYLRSLPLEEVVPRYSRCLRAFASRAGAERKYHATMTWAFLAVLDDAMKTSAAPTFDALVVEHPELLDRRVRLLIVADQDRRRRHARVAPRENALGRSEDARRDREVR